MGTWWMVRSSKGKYAADFQSSKVVAIGYGPPADFTTCRTKDDVIRVMEFAKPGWSQSPSDVSQLTKFVVTFSVGDHVVTYDRRLRQYLIGRIAGPYQAKEGFPRENLQHHRKVDWLGRVDRDLLEEETLNSLGSLLTIFELRQGVAEALEQGLQGKKPASPPTVHTPELRAVTEERGADRLEEDAIERIKDRVNSLSARQVPQLVAGILQSMGFKTRVSEGGSDRNRDIVASRDGLGLEPPRIVVEVKHREASVGAPQIRSFMAALNDADRALYVSTGGFSKEAHYEAERAKVPMTLVDLDMLVELFVEHYDGLDNATATMIPLKRIYWPVD